MPKGDLSKVMSILEIFNITDFYPSNPCIIQLHLKSALVCVRMNNNNSKQYVFQLHVLTLCDTANISTSGYTHIHMVHIPGAPCLIFLSGKQVLDMEHL